MKRFVFAAMLMVLVSGLAVAQDFPRVEVFGGYSLLKLGGEDIDSIYDMYADAPEGFSVSTSKWLKKGFDASAAFNINEYFGIEANFQYNQGNMLEASYSGPVEMGESIVDADVNMNQKVTDFSFMAGPRFTFRKNERVTPFAHFLVGLNRVKLSAEGSCVAEGGADCFEELMGYAELPSASDTGLGIMAGGGLDVNVNKSFAVRLIQADYFHARQSDDVSLNNLNLSFGVVFRFGGK